MGKKMKPEFYLISYPGINSRWDRLKYKAKFKKNQPRYSLVVE